MANEDVYAREAIDIHVDEKAGTQYKEVKNPMIEIMRELPDEAPNATHVALTHNGICWEIAGLAYNTPDKSEIEGGQPTMQQEQPEKTTPIRSPHPTAIKAGSGNMSKVLFFFSYCLCLILPYLVKSSPDNQKIFILKDKLNH